MKILVTNDDGIESEGIHSLARAISQTGHEIIVVAPDTNWSGAGAAVSDLGPGRTLDVNRVEIPGAPHIAAYSLDGPPALTVLAGRFGAFGDPPDLIVSGINAGQNTGRSILHSGTVGAVLAGQNFGIKGLAVSVETSDPWCWDTAASVAVEVLDSVVAAPPRSALNLNVPALPRGDIRGIRWARIAPFGAVRTRIESDSDSRIEFLIEPTGVEPLADTDEGCLRAGYAALTTIVGVVEAWPDPVDGAELEDVHYEIRLSPAQNSTPCTRCPTAPITECFATPTSTALPTPSGLPEALPARSPVS